MKKSAGLGSLPPFLQQLVSTPPRAGQGVHDWLYRVSRQLHAHLPVIEIIALLDTQVANCGRHVSRKEIEDAVKNSIECAWTPGRGTLATLRQPKWPSINEEKRAAIANGGGGLADLWERSPFRIENSRPKSEEVIDQLFPGNPLLCCGKSNREFDSKPRTQWRGDLSRLSLIVPSPMITPTGLTKDGKESAHSLNNTGQRRFLVVEFDSGSLDEHAAVLMHLAGYAPLVCVVHSGGKSLHGWFFVQNQPDDKVLKFFRYACSLGADSRLWTRSQFVRMPDGMRDNGNRQTVFFLNFRTLEVL